MNEDKKGIYKILNLLTEDFYIGSATLTFKRRFTQHRSDLRKGKHRNIHLQRAYNRDGESNFEYQILEIIEDESLIIPREQWYLDQKPHYNIATIADNSAKGRKMTEEQLSEHSKRLMGKQTWNKGMSPSEETRLKMSKSKIGRTPKNKGLKGQNFNPVIRSDGKEYKNPYEAAQELGVDQNYVVCCISDKKRNRHIKGYTFKYLPNPMKGIVKCKLGYSIRVKGVYLGYNKDLEEAKQIRDNYLDEVKKRV